MSNKGSGGNEDSTGVIIILLAVTVFAGSYFYDKYFYLLAEGWRWVRITELYMFAWIPEWFPVLGKLEFLDTIEYLKVTDGRLLSPEFVNSVDVHYGRHLSWIPALILVFLGFKLINKTDNVSRVFSMESLLKDRAPNYPFIQKFVNNHPEQMDIFYDRKSKVSKDYAVAVSPKLFASMKPPMGLEKAAKKDKELRKSSIWDGDVDFDWDLAERSFKSQVGRRYEGLSSLNATEIRLYKELKSRVKTSMTVGGAFIEKVTRAIVNGKKINGLTETEMVIFDAVKAIYIIKSKGRKALKKSDFLRKQFYLSVFKDNEIYPFFVNRHCEQVMANHAYIRTGLMSMLAETRNSGVVASLEFRHWLKGEDRTLWYCVSSVGRKVSFSESSGVFAHWLVEKELSRPIPQIFVEEAVTALKEALKISERLKVMEDEKAGF
jgi:hypothetical protein